MIAELREKFDWVICDSPAGIERGATLAMRHADMAIVVTNPEVSSVRDSDRIIGLLDAKTEKAERGERIEKHLLLTRYDPARAARGEMLKAGGRAGNPVDPAARDHSGKRGGAARLQPRFAGDAERAAVSAPARAYFDAAKRLRGETHRCRRAGRAPGLHGQAVRTEGRMTLFGAVPPAQLRAGRA